MQALADTVRSRPETTRDRMLAHGGNKRKIADAVARQLADLSNAGLTGIAVSFVNYIDELPFFCDEEVPRLEQLGVRGSRPH